MANFLVVCMNDTAAHILFRSAVEKMKFASCNVPGVSLNTRHRRDSEPASPRRPVLW